MLTDERQSSISKQFTIRKLPNPPWPHNQHCIAPLQQGPSLRLRYPRVTLFTRHYTSLGQQLNRPSSETSRHHPTLGPNFAQPILAISLKPTTTTTKTQSLSKDYLLVILLLELQVSYSAFLCCSGGTGLGTETGDWNKAGSAIFCALVAMRQPAASILRHLPSRIANQQASQSECAISGNSGLSLFLCDLATSSSPCPRGRINVLHINPVMTQYSDSGHQKG